jgi:hypothetical protein
MRRREEESRKNQIARAHEHNKDKQNRYNKDLEDYNKKVRCLLQLSSCPFSDHRCSHRRKSIKRSSMPSVPTVNKPQERRSATSVKAEAITLTTTTPPLVALAREVASSLVVIVMEQVRSTLGVVVSPVNLTLPHWIASPHLVLFQTTDQ